MARLLFLFLFVVGCGPVGLWDDLQLAGDASPAHPLDVGDLESGDSALGDPDPESGDPGPGDPGPGDPGPGDPGPGDPGLGDPGPGDPGLGDPGPGDPGLGDPGLGDPMPAGDLDPTVCSTQEVESGIDFTWQDIFYAPFPEKLQYGRDISMVGDRYFSVAFNTGSNEGTLTVTTIALQGGFRSISISQCPARFTTGTPAECFWTQGVGGAIQASTDPDSAGCVLAPNTNYFINVTYVDVGDLQPESSTCSGYCTVRFAANFASEE